MSVDMKTIEQLMADFSELSPNAKSQFLNQIVRLLSDGDKPDCTSVELQWLRIVMNQETRKLVKALNPGTLKVLELSGNLWQRQESFKEYKSVHYPTFDICQSKTNETFDLIIAEQVFEHLLWPMRAAKNVFEMLNPSGHFLITLPFLLKVHPAPEDCSRWTETGLKYFLAECGFPIESIKTSSWGNIACVLANLYRWVEYNPTLHSLHNEPNVPIVVWALAQK